MAMEIEEKHKCPPHHFIVDSNDIGRCVYCPEVRDFRKLQRRERDLGKLLRSERDEGTFQVTHGRRGRPRKNEGLL